jgi:hypothetical protein
MPDDESDDQPGPGGDGFLADLLRQSTITGTEKDDLTQPPEEESPEEEPEEEPEAKSAEEESPEQEPPEANRGTTEEDELDADAS